MNQRQLSLPPLYPIIDLGPSPDDEPALHLCSLLLGSPITILQLRAKAVPPTDALPRLTRFIKLIRSENSNVSIIINDEAELAFQLGADGVHLGQSDLSPEQARELLGPRAVIGLSTHNLEQVAAAQKRPVNYLGFGPVFASPTKFGHASITGLEGLRTACCSSTLQITAIGGITLANAALVYRAGAKSAAVISDLSRSTNPEETAQSYFRIYSKEEVCG